MDKTQTIGMMRQFMASDAVQEHSRRCIYENDDILVMHSVMSIADRLPVLVQQEQVAAHKDSQLAPKAPRAAAQEQRRINPHLLRDRDMVCKAFEAHAKDRGWDGDGKKPRGALPTFASRFQWPRGWKPRQHARAYRSS